MRAACAAATGAPASADRRHQGGDEREPERPDQVRLRAINAAANAHRGQCDCTTGEPACRVVGGRRGLRRHLMVVHPGRRRTGQAQHRCRVFRLTAARQWRLIPAHHRAVGIRLRGRERHAVAAAAASPTPGTVRTGRTRCPPWVGGPGHRADGARRRVPVEGGGPAGHDFGSGGRHIGQLDAQLRCQRAAFGFAGYPEGHHRGGARVRDCRRRRGRGPMRAPAPESQSDAECRLRFRRR